MLQKWNVNSWFDCWAEFLELSCVGGEFLKGVLLGGLSFLAKTGARNSTQELGAKFEALGADCRGTKIGAQCLRELERN